MFFTTEGRSS